MDCSEDVLWSPTRNSTLLCDDKTGCWMGRIGHVKLTAGINFHPKDSPWLVYIGILSIDYDAVESHIWNMVWIGKVLFFLFIYLFEFLKYRLQNLKDVEGSLSWSWDIGSQVRSFMDD